MQKPAAHRKSNFSILKFFYGNFFGKISIVFTSGHRTASRVELFTGNILWILVWFDSKMTSKNDSNDKKINDRSCGCYHSWKCNIWESLLSIELAFLLKINHQKQKIDFFHVIIFVKTIACVKTTCRQSKHQSLKQWMNCLSKKLNVNCEKLIFKVGRTTIKLSSWRFFSYCCSVQFCLINLCLQM
jgi:hypothetical protein